MTAALNRCSSLLRWLVLLEIGIWRSLFLWMTRRVPGQGPGALSFTYANQVSPVLGAFIFVSAVEAPVVHLLLPWDNLRFILLGISVWGLGWMVGFLASMRVFRHLLDGTGLRIRRGTTVDLRIPWSAIRSVESRRGSVSTNRAVQVEHGTGAHCAHRRAQADERRHRAAPVGPGHARRRRGSGHGGQTLRRRSPRVRRRSARAPFRSATCRAPVRPAPRDCVPADRVGSPGLRGDAASDADFPLPGLFCFQRRSFDGDDREQAPGDVRPGGA